MTQKNAKPLIYFLIYFFLFYVVDFVIVAVLILYLFIVLNSFNHANHASLWLDHTLTQHSIASHQENHTNRNYDQIDKETIDELNSLIGELDLFQKEHEMMERKLNEKLGYANSGDIHSLLLLKNENNHSLSQSSDSLPPRISTPTSRSFSVHNIEFSQTHNSDTSSDRNEKLSEASDYFTTFNHNGFIITDNDMLSSTSKIPIAKSELINSSLTDNNASDSLEGLNTGFENPSFLHLNDTEIVVIRQNAFPNEVDSFNHNVAEVITLKRDSNLKLDEIGNSDENMGGRQRLSSFRSVTPPLLLHTASLSSFSSNETFNTFNAIDINNLSTSSSRYYTRNHSLVEEMKVKPAITPRPASLSGLCCFFCFLFNILLVAILFLFTCHYFF